MSKPVSTKNLKKLNGYLQNFLNSMYGGGQKLSKKHLLSILKAVENNPDKISYCPHCSSSMIVKNGKNRLKIQRYKCKSCKKNFSSSTFSPLYHSKKPIEYWIKYLECLYNKFSVRASAEKTKIHRNTAFYWRHKILYSIDHVLPDALNGTIEIDETSFNENNKDKNACYHLFDTQAVSGIKPKVCIISCVDRTGGIFSKTACLNYANYSVVDSILDKKIPENSILYTTNHYKYESFARKHNLKLHKIFSNIYNTTSPFNLSKVKSFENSLHKLVAKCKGVATKYMNQYICWNKWSVLNCGKSLPDTISKSLLEIITLGKYLRIKDIKYINSLNICYF